MKKDFTNDDFERFLKNSASQLRMRPSDDVWKNIEKKMKGRRRRVFYTAALFLITFSFFGYYLVEQTKTLQDTVTNAPAYQTYNLKKKTTIIPASEQGSIENGSVAITTKNLKRETITSTERFALAPLPSKSGLPQQDETAPFTIDAVPQFTPTQVDAYDPILQPENVVTVKENSTAADPKNMNTIESVVNTYQAKKSKRKSEFQVFFTPTVSYRKLSENKSYLRSAPTSGISFNNPSRYDVNNVVTHKPDMGFELGFALKYKVARSIKLKSGLQFNITRYDIKAFHYIPEVATIALNNGNGIEALNTITPYRNMDAGLSSDWIQNTYFQVSAPLGVEFKVAGKKSTQFGIATTFQPTYVIGDRAYLISTDYKNYSQVPWLTRRWNVNTAIETFVSYSTGKLKWQVGPQVRYQLLSSFDTKYPVKENLFDFGLKAGISLNKD